LPGSFPLLSVRRFSPPSPPFPPLKASKRKMANNCDLKDIKSFPFPFLPLPPPLSHGISQASASVFPPPSGAFTVQVEETVQLSDVRPFSSLDTAPVVFPSNALHRWPYPLSEGGQTRLFSFPNPQYAFPQRIAIIPIASPPVTPEAMSEQTLSCPGDGGW